MSLRENDLVDTVLRKLSIDEFEPKTGNAKDVMVLGFYVTEQNAGTDLYHFLEGSPTETRDIDVSPNPTEEGHFMVFVELDREQGVFDNVKKLLKETERVSGKLKWVGRTYLNDDYLPLEELTPYIIEKSEDYMTREEFEEKQQADAEALKVKQEQDRLAAEESERNSISNQIMEFLKPTNLLQAGINNGLLHMQDARNVMSLEVIDFGAGKDILGKHGISEAAINLEYDRTNMLKLKGMLGELKVMPISEYVVIYNPADNTALLTKHTTGDTL